MVGEVIYIGHDGCRAAIWTLGAAVNELWVPDAQGQMASVVPGYTSIDDRLKGTAYLGEIVGPFANRIAAGRYELDGQTYQLALNDRGQSLHSGPTGLHRRQWEVIELGPDHVELGYRWPDGDEGFPGPIEIRVCYRITGQVMSHQVSAQTEQATPFSTVSHIYFNLSGTLEPITDHYLSVPASRYLPVDANAIPLPSAPAPVEGKMDLRQPRLLGEVVTSPEVQIECCSGLDHAYVIDATAGGELAEVCTLSHPASGRRLRIESDCPALQVYTGQGLGAQPGMKAFGALALETEEYPDAVNRPDFPSVILRPGETYRRTTHWYFGTED